MSKLLLYNGLKADLLLVSTTKQDQSVMKFKTVRLYRNDLQRENVEQPLPKPACLIEFKPSNYRERTNGIQEYDMTVRLHLIFESYKDEDTDILELVEATFAKVHMKGYENFSKLLRREETQDFDHDNVQDYMQDYSTMGTDYRADNRPTISVLASPVVLKAVIPVGGIGNFAIGQTFILN